MEAFEAKATRVLKRMGEALNNGRGVRLSADELRLICLGELGEAVDQAQRGRNPCSCGSDMAPNLDACDAQPETVWRVSCPECGKETHEWVWPEQAEEEWNKIN